MSARYVSTDRSMQSSEIGSSTKTFGGDKTIDGLIGNALCPPQKDEAARRFKGGALMITPGARGPPSALLSAAQSTCKHRHKSGRFPAERIR
jgi:hypothetical protein